MSPAIDSGGPNSQADHALTDLERRILELEAQTFRYAGAKERRIREDLGLSPTVYLIRLNRLLDNPAALAAAPALINRLRARRISSRTASSAQ
ncbi:DUF3263 domain-containing protein [Devriesea agamarum]|uniref:DUF3263 domain-containing protein n=1 Tax=Devriesea agamarum TaxID=472569 RepID=UPI00071D5B76|nr:DUF3263 domain-containing protein [Devriesea agamarum]